MDKLSRKVAIVTSAATGMGRATAIRLAQEGAEYTVIRFANLIRRSFLQPNMATNSRHRLLMVMIGIRC